MMWLPPTLTPRSRETIAAMAALQDTAAGRKIRAAVRIKIHVGGIE
jgi:hypothetical protein